MSLILLFSDEEKILQAIAAGIPLKWLLTTDVEELSEGFFTSIPKNVNITLLSKRTGKKWSSPNFAVNSHLFGPSS